MSPVTFLLTNSGSTDFTTYFCPTINLISEEKYEAALLSIDLYNSIPNVTDKNNKFKYSTDKGNTWKTITIPIGSYELNQINNEIQRQMIINDDYDKTNNEFYINIIPNIPELKSVIQITNDSYRVRLDNENSLLKTLGFEAQGNNELILLPGSNQSHNIVDITSINSVLVNVDFISGSYVNSKLLTAIYSFDPNKVPPGFKLNEKPNPLIYYPVNRSTIDSIRVWLTDQNNNPIDLRGERITVRLQIRKVNNIKQSVKQAIKELKEQNIL